jgi:hypothetical protein
MEIPIEIANIMKAHAEYEAQHATPFECCLCGDTVKQFGNNPRPVKSEGKCCNDCNTHYVIPLRMGFHFGINTVKKTINDKRKKNSK